jgi:hypothetical protein
MADLDVMTALTALAERSKEVKKTKRRPARKQVDAKKLADSL